MMDLLGVVDPSNGGRGRKSSLRDNAIPNVTQIVSRR